MARWRKENPEKSLEISRKNYRLHGYKQNKKKVEKYHSDEEYRQKCIEGEKRYVASGRRSEMNRKPEQMEKARIRNKKRRSDPKLKERDYKRSSEWRDQNRGLISELGYKTRSELKPCYLAQINGISVKDITPQIIETTRLIISLKRELKKTKRKN